MDYVRKGCAFGCSFVMGFVLVVVCILAISYWR